MRTRLAVITRFATRERGARYFRLGVNTSRMKAGRKQSMYRRESKLCTRTWVWLVKLVWQLKVVALAASTTWRRKGDALNICLNTEEDVGG